MFMMQSVRKALAINMHLQSMFTSNICNGNSATLIKKLTVNSEFFL